MEKTTTDILLLPGIFVFFGFLVYGVALFVGLREHTLPRFRWVSLGLMIVAVLVGVRTLWMMFDPSLGPFYNALIPDRRVALAHYVGVIMPLVAIGTLFGAEAWFKVHSRSLF